MKSSNLTATERLYLITLLQEGLKREALKSNEKLVIEISRLIDKLRSGKVETGE